VKLSRKICWLICLLILLIILCIFTKVGSIHASLAGTGSSVSETPAVSVVKDPPEFALDKKENAFTLSGYVGS
jgi:hypothetical protein